MARPLVHFKVDVPKISDGYGSERIIAMAVEAFGDNQCLVVKHTDVPGHHWHLQGELANHFESVTDEAFMELREKWMEEHPNRVASRARGETGAHMKRPVKVVEGVVGLIGYQYEMHCGIDSVVYQQGFTHDDLVELCRLSDEYVLSKKGGMKKDLKRKFETRPHGSPEAVYYAMVKECWTELVRTKVDIVPSHMHNQVFTAMSHAEWLTADDVEWLIRKR